jgi:phosphoglycerate dehydrogenase-like enzyme
MTRHIIVEQDAFMRMFVPMLDPTASQEWFDAVADFFAHDVPDFAGWVENMRQLVPALYPARVSLAEDQAHFRSLLGDADGCIIESLSFGQDEINIAKTMSVVQKYGAITRNIDSAACVKAGICVSTQRRRINVSLSELAFGLMTALGKHIIELNHVIDEQRLVAAGYHLRPYDKRYTGGSNFARIPGLRMMQGKTLGIIGFGEVGRDIARKARAFEMNVVYYQRRPLSPAEEGYYEARFLPLHDLLAHSDYISINLPVTAQTTGILGPQEFASIKHGAFLVNVARPELIDRSSLMQALDRGQLAGYGTDVWFERPARSDDAVFNYRNIVALPHTAIADRHFALADIMDMFMKMSDAIMARGQRV